MFGTGVSPVRPGTAQHLLLAVSDIEEARAEFVGKGVDANEIHHDAGGGYSFFDPGLRASGPDPARRSYASFLTFRDPDGNRWLLQEVTARFPGRVDPSETRFASARDLAGAMRRASAAHGRHDDRIGVADLNWPDWYAVLLQDTIRPFPTFSEICPAALKALQGQITAARRPSRAAALAGKASCQRPAQGTGTRGRRTSSRSAPSGRSRWCPRNRRRHRPPRSRRLPRPYDGGGGRAGAPAQPLSSAPVEKEGEREASFFESRATVKDATHQVMGQERGILRRVRQARLGHDPGRRRDLPVDPRGAAVLALCPRRAVALPAHEPGGAAAEPVQGGTVTRGRRRMRRPPSHTSADAA